MKTIAEQIGERLKATRLNRGLSMGNLAKLCGCGRPDKEVEEAAKTVVHAATEAIILKSLVSPKP